MVKLDVTLLRYLNGDDFRVLTSVEMGMKNHELVPQSLVSAISQLRGGGVAKTLHQLSQHRLVSYERGKRFDGYRLTYRGYDYLALNALSNRAVIASVGNQIGVGKESDVYVATDESGQRFAVKFHRLGRTCFRRVMEKRDYTRSGHKCNWIYLSRLAALREFAFMKVLTESQSPIPVPKPVDCNRHCLVMQLVDGTLLNQVSKDDIDADSVPLLYDKLMNLIITLANDFGLIHGDFNEFNVIINPDLSPVLIDFPQMISVSHKSAVTYFERDVNCIIIFFAKRFGYESDFIPCFENIDKESEEKLNQLSAFVEKIGVEENDIDIKEIIDFEPTVDRRDSHSDIDGDEQLANQVNDIELNVADVEGVDNNSDNESFPGGVSSIATTTTTFSALQIRDKLKRERKRNENRIRTKRAVKNVKGEGNAFRRQRKDNYMTANDDLKAYCFDGF